MTINLSKIILILLIIFFLFGDIRNLKIRIKNFIKDFKKKGI